MNNNVERVHHILRDRLPVQLISALHHISLSHLTLRMLLFLFFFFLTIFFF